MPTPHMPRMPDMSRLAAIAEELWLSLFAWIPTTIGVGARLVAWQPLFCHCGRVRFGQSVTVQGCRNIALADGVRIGKGCHLYARTGALEMGENAALNINVVVDADGGHIRMGAHVTVGPGTVIRAANHNFDRTDVPIMFQGHEYGEVTIEDDVWIAANCTITPGVRIGRGAVVGAGAVVTKDVEPYTVVGGVPAKPLRKRGMHERAATPSEA